jgi:predicted DNA-binding protein (UPF0251 family)
MSRPPDCRRISADPVASIFKPAGVPVRLLNRIEMTLDEFEAIRLADLEGLYQEQAAERMQVSRKVAEALVQGRALVIRGGFAHPAGERCPRCRA